MRPIFAGCTPKQLVALFAFALLIFTSISCDNDDDGQQMPPYSTTGAGTFGAYVNGELWLPRGRAQLFRTNFSVNYESGYEGGTITIIADRKMQFSKDSTYYDRMILAKTHVDHEGVYSWGEDTSQGSCIITQGSCEYYQDSDVYRKGTLEVTRLDLEKGIVAGKFEFTVAKAGCDTLKVTGGRFDYNLF